MPSEGQIIGGTYRLVQLIGKGGMGSVWKAEKITTHEKLAIKFMKQEYIEDEISRERFKREVEILKTIRHPNVVYVFDWHLPDPKENEQPYIVMELLEGEPLIELLKREDKIGTEDTIAIMLQVLDALVEAHNAGVVHRDLGPQNVFLLKDTEKKFRVKLLDFGLAKPVASKGPRREITRVGTVLGRVTYAAPEYFLGQPTGERSDIFSCGMMMMRMLTGRLPYKESKIDTLWSERRQDSKTDKEYASARSFNKNIPQYLDKVISRAVKKKPEDRFQAAFEMQAELLQIEVEMDAVDDEETGEMEEEEERTAVYVPRHEEQIRKFFDSLEKEKLENVGSGAVARPSAGGLDSDEKSDADGKSLESLGSVDSVERDEGFLSTLKEVSVQRRILLPAAIAFAVFVIFVLTVGVFFYSGMFGKKSRAGDKTHSGKTKSTMAAGGKKVVAGVGISEKAGEGAVGEMMAAPEKIHVIVRGTPEGAYAKAGDYLLQGLPLEGDIPKGEKPLEMRIDATGYETYVVNIIPSKDLEISVEMNETSQVEAEEGPEEGEEEASAQVEEKGGEKETAEASEKKPQGKKKKGGKKKKTGKKKVVQKKPEGKKEGIIKGKLGTTISTDYDD